MLRAAAPAPASATPPADPLAGRVDGLETALVQMLGASPWMVRIALALLIGLVGWWVLKLLVRGLDRVMQRAGMDQILRDFLRNLARAIGLVVVLVAVLDALGVPTTSLLAVLGAAGLAIGLALKDSLANIASGVMLIVLRPFRAGDVVEIAGRTGVVERVRIFHTVLRTFENHELTLPNGLITAEPILNFTARGMRRIDLPVGIGYGDDIGKARAVLLEMAAAQAAVLTEPPPEVIVDSLGDSAINLVLRAWVNTPDFAPTRSALLEGIHREFGKAGVSIPFPQRDLHVYHHGRPPEGSEPRTIAYDGD
ncbi:mechanosensitive ion channel family protein [Arenimonas fontis]|uniref:Small-conductance mechanosensitive channel n=1 Tax=Arenimonas fontis TaxID=2608255 RepID=A0A5B2ZB82_9GAMM|nr:mechanosensitive ion channel domain-containing protein [Arenimonas fontis]KAA2285938.1 mechanosensitive ion channel [Arenimonas fontis]